MNRVFSVILLFLVTSVTVLAQTNVKPLVAGATAPDFTLMDHEGRKTTLSDFKGKSPVVLVFYRGYW